jgi:hypothetical protein
MADSGGEGVAAARRRLAELRAGSSRSVGSVGSAQAEGGLAGDVAHGRGECADGRVSAVVSRGRVESIELDPRLLRGPASDVGGRLVEAVNAALDDLWAGAPAESGPELDVAGLVGALEDVQQEGFARLMSMQSALDEAAAKIRAGLSR